MLRRRLLAAASLIAVCSAPAFAQEDVTIDDERDEPVDTGSANGGAAANLIIGANGRVRLTNLAGPAVRVNSDNNLTTESGSRIEIIDQDADGNDINLDGAVGVQIDPGVTSDFTHGGSILLDDSYIPEASDTDTDLIDADGDGEVDDPDREVDGPFALDTNKIGLLVGELDANGDPVAGQAGVTGTLTLENGSVINVQGQDSFGARLVTDVSGDVLSNGNILMTGERSTALSIEGNVGGDVQIQGVNARSPEGVGVNIAGDVAGGLRFNGQIQVSGFRVDTRLAEEAMALFDPNDDDLDARAAVIVAGSIVDGVFISNFSQINFISGAGSAVEIGQGGETVTLGTVRTPDDFGATTPDEDEDEEIYDHSLINRGLVSASGIFDGNDATAFFIGGRDENGNLRAVILSGQGFLNDGTIRANTFDGTSVGVRFGEGVQGSTFTNSGRIETTAAIGYADDGFDSVRGSGQTYAVILDDGSAIQTLLNDQGTILSIAQNGSAASSATGIKVDSDQLQEIINAGQISVLASGTAPEDFNADATPRLIAIDARGHDGGLRIVQRDALDVNGDPVELDELINGDVIFGDGDDELELLSGQLIGDVEFGLGADRLTINGAELRGAITDADANLTIDVTNGQILLTGTDTLALTDATFGDGATLQIEIDTTTTNNAFIQASGSVTFENGSDLSVGLANLIENTQEFALVSAGTLTVNDQTVFAATEAPFLYNAAIQVSDADANTLVISLTRKSSEELGMNASQAAAYDEAFAVMTSVDSLGAAFAGVRTADDFFGAYNQLLPEYAASAIQFSLASNDAAAGALATRLRNARLSPDELAGVWIQEFGYFADRAGTSFGPGYRGQGVGLAMGIDRPMGPFYAVGFHLVGAASEVEEFDGFDEPMVAMTGQIGTYLAMDVGGFDVSGSLGLGYDYFETERNIIIDAFSTTNTAEWSGWHIAAAAQAGRDFSMGRWNVRPEASVTWLSLFESGYTEQNEDAALSALALIVDDRESTVLTAAGTVQVARRFGTDISWWAPSVHVGYRGELIGDSTDTVAQFGENGSPFTLQSEALPGSGILAGFGLSAGSQYTTFTFAYDADVRDQFVRHVARLVVRLTF